MLGYLDETRELARAVEVGCAGKHRGVHELPAQTQIGPTLGGALLLARPGDGGVFTRTAR